MIDWLTVRVPGAGEQVRAGVVMCIDPHGEIEWAAPRRQQVEGSHSSKVLLRHHSLDGSLEISGNPAKWLQGHNIFGTWDVPGLAADFVLSVCHVAGIELNGHQRKTVLDGVMRLTRIDLTESWDLGSQRRAVAAVQAISEMGYLKHRGRGSLTHEGTCYFGKQSRRISAKCYAKGLELVKHPIAPSVEDAGRLRQYADSLLRLEWTLRRMWLQAHPLALDLVCNWRHTDAAALFRTLLEGLNISEAAMTEPKALEGLPPRLHAIYLAWLEGHDVRAFIPARSFYRYRRELLAHGVDLAVKRPRAESNVIPLRVVLTGHPVGVPDWAKGTALYWDPSARKLAA